MTKIYKVYDRDTGRTVCEGTATMCREKLGVSDTAFRDAAIRGHWLRGKYKVVDLSIPDAEVQIQPSYQEAIKKWDDFCAPIRARYGIPVYGGGTT